MSCPIAQTPRVFLIRHGETAWTISGQHTGTSDIPLTPHGERQVSSMAAVFVGPGKLLDPSRVIKVLVSPRQRARRTFELLFHHVEHPAHEKRDLREQVAGISACVFGGKSGNIEVTERVAEWDYGEYEGITPADVRKRRKADGLDSDEFQWDVRKHGCPGGESKADVTRRVDLTLQQVRQIQQQRMNDGGGADVVIVAHGLIGQCFIKRWLNLPIDAEISMEMSPGALAILGYKGGSIDKPMLYIGTAIPAAEHCI